MLKTRPKAKASARPSPTSAPADDTLVDPLTAPSAALAPEGRAAKGGIVGKLKALVGLGKKKDQAPPDAAGQEKATRVMDGLWALQGQIDNLKVRGPQAIAEKLDGLPDDFPTPPFVEKMNYILALADEATASIARTESAYYDALAGGSMAQFKNSVLSAMSSLTTLRQALAGGDGGVDGLTVHQDGILVNPMLEAVGGEQVLNEGAYGALKKGQDHRQGPKSYVDGSGQLSRGANTPAQLGLVNTYGPAYLKLHDLVLTHVKALP